MKSSFIGKQVTLRPSYARWHLDHPELYEGGSGVDECYEEETLIHLICCLGEPVYGTILAERDFEYTWIYEVRFKISNLTMTYWVSARHIRYVL